METISALLVLLLAPVKGGFHPQHPQHTPPPLKPTQPTPLTKDSDARALMLDVPEWTIEQTIETAVVLDTIVFIMTSLWWHNALTPGATPAKSHPVFTPCG